MERKIAYTLVAVVVIVIIGFTIWNYERSQPSPRTTRLSEQGEPTEVTPTDEMRVRTAEKNPVIDLATWRLAVSGLVDRELSISFEDLQALGAEERELDLPCVEGWTERGLWKGARLADVLERAGLAEGAETVVFSSPGGYTTSLTIADIEETDPLLAWQVNGEPLPEEQGFPVRLVVPDRLGYKWIKWVTGIEVIQGEYEGYWESAGYSNEADASRR